MRYLTAARRVRRQTATLGLAFLFLNGVLAADDSPCDLNGDSKVTVADVQHAINQGLGSESCGGGDLNRDGRCDVVDVQRFVNASMGKPCLVGDSSADASKPVLDYGVKCDGVTDDTNNLQAALNDSANWTSGALSFPPSGTCVVSSGLTWTSSGRPTILGRGATIKAKNGMPVNAGYDMLRVAKADGATIDDLDFDANRIGRARSEAEVHTLEIRDTRGLTIRKVDVRNSVTDGFYLDAADPRDMNTIPRNITFIDSTADSSYRHGMSIVAGRDITIKGACDGGAGGTCTCHFINTDGTVPAASVDPGGSVPGTLGVERTVIEGCQFTADQGYGIKMTNSY